jgi:hypothetical protein
LLVTLGAALSVLSFMICILFVGLWVRSYGRSDEFVGTGQGRQIVVRSSHGVVLIHYIGPAARFGIPRAWSHNESAFGARGETFGAGWEMIPGIPARVGYLLFPHYILVLFTLITPTLSLWAALRKRYRTHARAPRGFPIDSTEPSPRQQPG